jgi:hypothetical protein
MPTGRLSLKGRWSELVPRTIDECHDRDPEPRIRARVRELLITAARESIVNNNSGVSRTLCLYAEATNVTNTTQRNQRTRIRAGVSVRPSQRRAPGGRRRCGTFVGVARTGFSGTIPQRRSKPASTIKEWSPMISGLGTPPVLDLPVSPSTSSASFPTPLLIFGMPTKSPSPPFLSDGGASFLTYLFSARSPPSLRPLYTYPTASSMMQLPEKMP